MTDIETRALEIARQWASEPFDADTRKEVQALIDKNDMEIGVSEVLEYAK